MSKYLSITVVVSFLLSSCYMDKSFLSPTNTVGRQKLTLRDSIVTFFNANAQPVFTKFGKDTINYPFSVESVFFESKSGNKLNAWILKPKNQNPKATIIHFHGNGGLLLSQFEAIAPLTEKGFQIFMFDYSGFGFSEGEAKRRFVLDDGISAVDFVKNNPAFSNTKLILYGQSFGGHLATVVATMKQQDIAGLVSEGAFSSHDDIAGQSFWNLMARLWVREMYAAKKYIRELKKPVLIIHSVEDRVIPFKLGQKLYKKANQPKSFFEIKGSHIMGVILYRDEIAQKIDELILNK